MITINDIYETYKNIMDISKNFARLPSITIGDDDNPDVISPFEREDFMAWSDFDKEDAIDRIDGAMIFGLRDKDIEKDDREKIKESLLSSYASIFKLKETELGLEAFDMMMEKRYIISKTPATCDLKSNMVIMRVAFYDGEAFILHVLRNIEDEFFGRVVKREWDDFLSLEMPPNSSQHEIKTFLKRHLPDLILMYYLIDRDIYDIVKEGKSVSGYNVLADAFTREDFEIFKDFVRSYSGKTFEETEIIQNTILSYFYQIYENYLKEKSLSFKDYNINFAKIIESCCRDGIYVTSEALSEQIGFLWDYYSLLKKDGRDVDFILDNLDDAKNNILTYQNILKKSTKGFYLDDDIFKCVINSDWDPDDSKFLDLYESFLDIVDNEYITVLKNGNISPGILQELAKTFEVKPTREVKTFKNYHFPLFQIFLSFSEMKDILVKESFEGMTYLSMGDNAQKYFMLPEEIKKSLWISTMLNENFVRKTFGNDTDKYAEFIIDFTTNLAMGRRITKHDIKSELMPLIDGLILFGIIKGEKEYKLTRLGKILYDYFSVSNKKNNVIKVDFSK
ncbi:hypothetical protein [Peptoniphilus sp.]|jgi:hypothetical protein|uniref:hypothetical protein n=1 Tax=Peptoniphilus sp. TaxID=1971214 RepID=UPI003D9061DD